MHTLEKNLGQLFKPVPARRSDPDRKAREEAKALAKEHGITLEAFKPGEGSGLNVWPSGTMKRSDPWEGDHYAQDWKEAMHMVRTYAGLEGGPSEASMLDATGEEVAVRALVASP